jgi:hypothetical protein
MPARTPAGDALTDLVLPAFELNGEFLAAAEEMTRPVGLTPAWWQVLGATLDEPLPVAERGSAWPARASSGSPTSSSSAAGPPTRTTPRTGARSCSRRPPTADGRAAVARLAEAQHAWADAVGAAVGEDELRRVVTGVRRISDASRAYRAGASSRAALPTRRDR